MHQYITQDAPKTYVLDYGGHMDRVEESLEKVREAPPEMLHVHGDTPFRSWAGVSKIQSLGYPFQWGAPTTLAEARVGAERVRQWLSELHAAGVEIVFPYICSQTMGGDPDERLGMWRFYDHWDEFAELVGPKIPVELTEWLQREPDGTLHFNYPYRFPICAPPRRFAPCYNNPYWLEWLTRVVKLLADHGYDGTFVDNNIQVCHCEHCQAAFREYLTETYPADERRERFGTADIAALKLATLGDKVLWAQTVPEYMQEIHDKEPEEFLAKFGTDDVEETVFAEAGGGFHWGRANDFWRRTLAERFGPEEAARIQRVGDVSTLGVTKPEELCLWADTQMFWAWTIGRRGAQLRGAVEEAGRPFRIIPNWGDMSGFDHVNSRRVGAKNIRLWKPGADVLFLEESYLPGTLAPGYTFDLLVPHKYSVACGVRACALRYHGSDSPARCELATAEAAAFTGDGMFSQPGYLAPEMRAAYRSFFETKRDWYAGRAPWAQVALVFSFDELHLENMHHMREVFPLARYLADHHILFDVLNEKQVTAEHLARYRCVIVPHVQYLPKASRRDLLAYAEGGGAVLCTGNTGAFDEHARPSTAEDLLAELHRQTWDGGQSLAETICGSGSLAWVRDIETWFPERAWQIHDLADYHVEFDRLKNEIVPELQAAAGSEPPDDPRLAGLLDAMTGESLAVMDEHAPPTLRAACWQSAEGAPSLVLHFVNFDVPGPGLPAAAPAVPVENVTVSLPLPEGMAVSRVVLADPWRPDPVSVPFAQAAGRVEFSIDRVDVYRLALVE